MRKNNSACELSVASNVCPQELLMQLAPCMAPCPVLGLLCLKNRLCKACTVTASYVHIKVLMGRPDLLIIAL
jgi:hypothetical protein